MNELTTKTDGELKEIMRNSIDNSYVSSSIYHKAKQELEFRNISKHKNEIEVANISPKQMVNTFINNSPIQARTIIDKYYIGVWIKVSGKIESIDLMTNYTTFNFHDKDGIYISANFSKPLSSEVSLVNKGALINLIGQVFNVAQDIVVLDHCILITKDETVQTQVTMYRDEVAKSRWWEKTWVQIIFLLGAIAGIIGLFLFK